VLIGEFSWRRGGRKEGEYLIRQTSNGSFSRAANEKTGKGQERRGEMKRGGRSGEVSNSVVCAGE